MFQIVIKKEEINKYIGRTSIHSNKTERTTDKYNLGDSSVIMLNERGQRQKVTDCRTPFNQHSRKDKTMMKESRSADAGVWIRGRLWLYRGHRGLLLYILITVVALHENSQKIHSKKRQFYPMITKKNNRIFKIFRYLQNSLLQSTVMRKISGKIVLRDILQNSWPRTLQSVMFKKEKEVSQILRGLRRHDN